MVKSKAFLSVLSKKMVYKAGWFFLFLRELLLVRVGVLDGLLSTLSLPRVFILSLDPRNSLDILDKDEGRFRGVPGLLSFRVSERERLAAGSFDCGRDL